MGNSQASVTILPEFGKFTIDVELAARELPAAEYEQLAADGDEGLQAQLLERFDQRFVRADLWVEFVSPSGRRRGSLSAREILAAVYTSASVFEEGGLGVDALGRYVAVRSCWASGQAGGIGILDSESGTWIYRACEDYASDIMWVPAHQVFVALSPIHTYSWRTTNLYLINLNGERAVVNLYSANPILKVEPTGPEYPKWITRLEDDGTEADYNLGITADGQLLICDNECRSGSWRCDLAGLLKDVAFSRP